MNNTSEEQEVLTKTQFKLYNFMGSLYTYVYIHPPAPYPPTQLVRIKIFLNVKERENFK